MSLYPGLGLPLRHWPQSNFNDRGKSYPLGAHPNISGSNSELLPVREVAMMGISNRLTDKENWHKKVFDEKIVEKWRQEAMAIPDDDLMAAAAAPNSDWVSGHGQQYLTAHGAQNRASTKVKGIMSDRAFKYCVEELRSKAKYFEKTGLIPTLDASATVVKSDTLVKDDLRESLRQAFQRLQTDQAEHPDWHPGSGDMVQDLVHPSMYPLVYGQSRVLNDEVVGTVDAIERWAGKGKVIEKDEDVQFRGAGFGDSEIPSNYWSNTYQWLPSNVAFQDDGSVKFTSYINNLHPTKYPEIYSTVEKLIECVLPAWDHCLTEVQGWRTHGPGRQGSRFRTPYGADDEDRSNWDPSDPAELADAGVDPSQAWRVAEEEQLQGDDEDREEHLGKWKVLRTPVLREPRPFKEVDYSPYGIQEDSEESGSAKETQPENKLINGLREKFQKAGLQVIVKMASIELTPDKPEFPAGGWHIEGQMNERICATALYYLDSDNITDSSLAFRMHTCYDQEALQDEVGQDSYHWLECFYGTSFGNGGTCIQNYGSVETREGRLLAFPNVFQHRVSDFKLTDPSKPGHRRFIALWLVDPHCRIISTANVPPQQQDWWAESTFGKSESSQKSAADKLPADVAQLLRERGVPLPEQSEDKGVSLPPELLNMVRQELEWSAFSREEAEAHRKELMEERGAHHRKAVQTWNSASYNFCEH